MEINKLILNHQLKNLYDNSMDINNIDFWYRENDIKETFTEKEIIGFYKSKLETDLMLAETTALSNMHIYEKWRDFLHDNLLPEFCNIKNENAKDCLNCPTRIKHLNYVMKYFNIDKFESYKQRYDLPINYVSLIPEYRFEELFFKFIKYYRDTPKKTGEKRSPNTIATYIKQIKRWQKIINKEKGLNLTFANKFKVKEVLNIVEPIPAHNLNTLTSFILGNSDNYSSNKLNGKKIKAIYFLMLQSGLRLNEICIINQEDINYSKDGTAEITIIGKGRKKRIIGISQESVIFIKDYLKERHAKIVDIDPALFINNNFERINKTSIIQYYRRISKITGIKFSAHALRRTSATLRVKDGGDLIDLMNNYGWKSESVARRYMESAKNIESINSQKNFNPYSTNKQIIEDSVD